MYLREEIERLSEDIRKSLVSWGNNKIEELCIERPKLRIAAPYLKRGLSNWANTKKDEVRDMTNTLAMFVADSEGNIDTNTLIDDAITIFKDMDKQYAEVGLFGIEYGKGELLVHVPKNMLCDMIFGDLGKIKITADDLLEMKAMLKG